MMMCASLCPSSAEFDGLGPNGVDREIVGEMFRLGADSEESGGQVFGRLMAAIAGVLAFVADVLTLGALAYRELIANSTTSAIRAGSVIDVVATFAFPVLLALFAFATFSYGATGARRSLFAGCFGAMYATIAGATLVAGGLTSRLGRPVPSRHAAVAACRCGCVAAEPGRHARGSSDIAGTLAAIVSGRRFGDIGGGP